MTVFGKKGLASNTAVTPVVQPRTDACSGAWEDLVASHHGSGSGAAHQSRHASPIRVGEAVESVADVVVATAIVDTALNIHGSNANYRDALGISDTESAHDLAQGAGAGLAGALGSIFGT